MTKTQNATELLPTVESAVEEAMTSFSVVDGYVTAFALDGKDKKSQKNAFLAGEIDNPTLNIGTKMPESRDARKKSYRELCAVQSYLEGQLQENPYNPEILLSIHTVMKWRSQLAAIHAADVLAGEDLHSDPSAFMGSKSALEEHLREWMQEVHGTVDIDLACQLSQGFKDVCEEVDIESLPEHLRPYFAEYSQGLNSINENYQKTKEVVFFQPDDETLEHFKKLLLEDYGETFAACIDYEKESYSYEETVEVVQNMLDFEGYGAKGWRAVFDESKTGLSVDNSKLILYIGTTTKFFKDRYTPNQISYLYVHERKHLERYQRAIDEDKPLIVAKGPAGYLEFEEGWCVFLQQCWTGEVDTAVYDYRYLAGAYAQGAIDGEFHDFRDCFNYVMGYALSSFGLDGLDDSKIQKLESTVYEAVNRFFRAMPSDGNGANDLSALSYRAGYNKVGQVVRNREGELLSQEEYDRLNVGKIDPTNPEHIALAA